MEMSTYKGYQCEVIEEVNNLFYCKECGFIARRLTITTCCKESFCYSCILNQQDKPCPECGQEKFDIYEQNQFQHCVRALRIYCSLKERGCEWSGTVDRLDTHLDNCQYVDTKCPLKCLETIPKNKVGQHVTQECSKRSHICQYCDYKATYEEVVDTHLPECKYAPLQCPNLCGVSCDREHMEDHMKICLKEEVECAFKGVGCTENLLDFVYISDQFRYLHIKNFAYVTKDTKFSWQSPVMRTHTGTKFFIGVHRHDLYLSNMVVIRACGGPVGYAVGEPVCCRRRKHAARLTGVLFGGKMVDVTICRLYATAHAIRGKCDDVMNWPLNVEIIIEIVKENEQNVRHIIRTQWKRPHQSYNEIIRRFESHNNVIQAMFNGTCMLGEISELKESSINGTLHIEVVGIKFHN